MRYHQAVIFELGFGTEKQKYRLEQKVKLRNKRKRLARKNKRVLQWKRRVRA